MLWFGVTRERINLYKASGLVGTFLLHGFGLLFSIYDLFLAASLHIASI